MVSIKKLLCLKTDIEVGFIEGNIYFSDTETSEEYGIKINNNFYWIKKYIFKELNSKQAK